MLHHLFFFFKCLFFKKKISNDQNIWSWFGSILPLCLRMVVLPKMASFTLVQTICLFWLKLFKNISIIHRSVHRTRPHTALLCFCLGVLPSGWDQQRMWHLLKTPFSFSETPPTQALMMFWLVPSFLGLFCSFLYYYEGPDSMATWFEGTADDVFAFLCPHLW